MISPKLIFSCFCLAHSFRTTKSQAFWNELPSPFDNSIIKAVRLGLFQECNTTKLGINSLNCKNLEENENEPNSVGIWPSKIN